MKLFEIATAFSRPPLDFARATPPSIMGIPDTNPD
jgi:hypothetical protein